ncbi:copper homeostasis membrane protein CopD [Salinicola salarius]|uniref:copper homeostasis membrane protein CopD n=1 Tax=Salinicola salarius TaxID=430457 RepID=UPI0023E43E78|nr:copper homeostasis membrane protein CopD [Salinicola salarius]MDF3917870.1 copper homeostasis membrane protein CopD [Salinicola salarius]
MIDSGTALVVSRFAFDAAALFLWGSSTYLLSIRSRELRGWLWGRLAALRWSAIGVATVVTLASLPLRTADMAGAWSATRDAELLWRVATQTTIGAAWLCQTTAVALLLAASVPKSRRRLPAVALSSALMLGSLTISGHAAMHAGELGWLHRGNDWLHLLAGGFWIGALPAVVLLLGRLGKSNAKRSAVMALARFSNLGHVAVAVVLLSGVINTGLIVGGWPNDWSMTYQRLLGTKIALVLIMVLVALYNRYRLVPRLTIAPDALIRLKRATLLELTLATAIIVLVAAFGMMQPR